MVKLVEVIAKSLVENPDAVVSHCNEQIQLPKCRFQAI